MYVETQNTAASVTANRPMYRETLLRRYQADISIIESFLKRDVTQITGDAARSTMVLQYAPARKHVAGSTPDVTDLPGAISQGDFKPRGYRRTSVKSVSSVSCKILPAAMLTQASGTIGKSRTNALGIMCSAFAALIMLTGSFMVWREWPQRQQEILRGRRRGVFPPGGIAGGARRRKRLARSSIGCSP